MGERNEIHPTAIVGEGVELGEGNRILPYTVLYGPLKIGNNNIIGPHVVIGTPGQDTKNPRYDSSKKRIEIGDDNIIREFTGIQKALDTELTLLGSRIHLMQSVHIPHDARVGDDVVITPMSVLAGNVKLMRAANLGLGTKVHQSCVLGAFCMIAMNAAVTKNIRPFGKFIPGRPLSVNSYALKKFGLLEHAAEVEAYVLSGATPTAGPIRVITDEFQRLHEASGRALYGAPR